MHLMAHQRAQEQARLRKETLGECTSMPVIITGSSALSILRMRGITDERFDAMACRRILEGSYPTRLFTQAALGSPTFGYERVAFRNSGLSLVPDGDSAIGPHIDVVVHRHQHVRPITGLITHYASYPLIDGSLFRVDPALGIGDDIYVTAPALSWIFMSQSLNDLGALEQAFELCGSYAVSADGSLLTGIAPVTTSRELMRQTRGIARAACDQRVPGLSRAMAMAPYVLDNSASPMETKVAIMLSLPVNRGGWGITDLALNQRFDLSREQREIARKTYLVIDGCIASKRLGYEYDSREFHDRDDREYSDRVRLAAVQCLGLRVLPLTADIVMDELRCTSFFDELARLAGKRIRKLGARTLRRRCRVRRELGLPVAERFWSNELDVPLEVYEAAD